MLYGNLRMNDTAASSPLIRTEVFLWGDEVEVCTGMPMLSLRQRTLRGERDGELG